MPYDPSLPANHSPVSSAELRGQLQGLKAEIDDKIDDSYLQGVLAEQTSGSVASVPEPGLSFSNPPTQAEVEALASFVNAVVVALRRE